MESTDWKLFVYSKGECGLIISFMADSLAGFMKKHTEFRVLLYLY